MHPDHVSEHILTLMTLILAKRTPEVEVAVYPNVSFELVLCFEIFAAQITHIAANGGMKSFHVSQQAPSGQEHFAAFIANALVFRA